MKKAYLYSFLLGLGIEFLFIFGPYFGPVFYPVGKLYEVFVDLVINIFHPSEGFAFLYLGIPYYVISTPFFIGFILIPWFRKKLEIANNKISFLFLSFLFFSLGVILAYGIFLILVAIWLTQINPWIGYFDSIQLLII